MLNKETILICIELLNKEIAVYKNVNEHSEKGQWWNTASGKLIYKYKQAVKELTNELQTIEEENLSD